MSAGRGHPAGLDGDRLLAECSVERTRRSGPGGQNRNKVETAVVLHHRPTGLRAEANERRSQGENLRVALFRLRTTLAREVRTARGPGTSPSPLWLGRCRGGRLTLSETHDDFPTLLAEALDVLEGRGLDLPAAALVLGCSGSQVLKLLRRDPLAFTRFNAGRRARGLPPLA